MGTDQDLNRRGQVAAAIDGLMQRHTFDREEKLKIYGELLTASALALSDLIDEGAAGDELRAVLIDVLQETLRVVHA